MGKKYKSIKDLVEGLSESQEFKENIKNEILSRSLAKYLFTLRCENNLTQKELSDRVGCSQSRISKIEGSYDKDITLSDLFDYGEAFNLQLELGYRNKNAKIVDLVNYHIFRIKEYLNALTNIAKGDKSIDKGVFTFFEETLYNMIDLVTENLSKLDTIKNKRLRDAKEPIHLSSPLIDKLDEIKKSDNVSV